MSSGISSNRDMAYVGEKPWHGLGSKLEAGASIEEWRSAAGMDWQIFGSPVRYQVPLSSVMRNSTVETIRVVSDKQVLFRSDDGNALGVVGDGFKIVQPVEVLEFFRDLTEKAGFVLDTAGCLFGGKRFWALAKTGEDCEVVPGDVIRDYLLLCTGADGSLATTGKYVSERVVCNNTLGVALREGGVQAKISHRSVFSAQAMKNALQIDTAHRAFGELTQQAKRLADQSCSRLLAQSMALALLAPKDINEHDKHEQMKLLTEVEESKGFAKIISLFDGEGRGAQLDGVKGTKWGFLNAVTQYADHETRAKSADHRMARVIDGSADDMKAKALELCLK